MLNSDRLSLFFLATCNFSQFDDPKAYTGGELLMNHQAGGAVAVISACRKVYAGSNKTLAQGTFREMFGRDIFGRVAVERPATSLFLYKNGIGNYANDQKYIVLGDPTMRLQYPVRYASIDSVNGEPVDTVGGAPRTSLIQLRSLSRVTVQGSMRDGLNQFDPNFTGKVSLVVNDATRVKTIVNFYPGRNWDYLETGSTIFRGEHSVTDGRFTATFVVPKDVAYADSNAAARILGYIAAPGIDGSAYTGKVRIGGTDTTAVPDAQGPTVDLYLENRSFRPGDLVSPNPMLIVDLRRLERHQHLRVRHRPPHRSLGEQQHRKHRHHGAVHQQAGQLPRGIGAVPARRAHGGAEYAARACLGLVQQLLNDGDLLHGRECGGAHDRGRVSIIPTRSPARRSSRSGTTSQRRSPWPSRSIPSREGSSESLETVTAGDLFVRIPWDGRDRDGDEIANGVYLYKVVASTARREVLERSAREDGESAISMAVRVLTFTRGGQHETNLSPCARPDPGAMVGAGLAPARVLAQGESAVPFLLIAPTSRFAGIGEAGPGWVDDASAIFWNPGALAFLEGSGSEPDPCELAPPVQPSGPVLRSPELPHEHRRDRRDHCASVTYLNLGEFSVTGSGGPEVIGKFKSYEYAITAGYSTPCESLGLGVNLRFIHSALSPIGTERSRGTALRPRSAFDLARHVPVPIPTSGASGKHFVRGINLSNSVRK